MLTYQTKLANMVTIICSPCYYRCIIIDCILYTVKTVSLLVSECHFESVQHFANFLWVSSYERSVLCLYVPYLLLKRLDNVNFTHQNWRTNFYFGKLKKSLQLSLWWKLALVMARMLMLIPLKLSILTWRSTGTLLNTDFNDHWRSHLLCSHAIRNIC